MQLKKNSRIGDVPIVLTLAKAAGARQMTCASCGLLDPHHVGCLEGIENRLLCLIRGETVAMKARIENDKFWFGLKLGNVLGDELIPVVCSPCIRGYK